MIVILTGPDDRTADLMERELDRRGAAFIRFDPAGAAGAGATGVSFGAGARRQRLGGEGGSIDLDAVTGVWWRRPSPFAAPPSLTCPVTAAATAAEVTAVMMGLLDTLDRPGVTVVPAAYQVTDRAQGKPRQLGLAARLGFEIPPTLITDDPDELLDFAGRHDRLVTKRATPGLPLATPDGETVLRYTDVVRPIDLLHADTLRFCPVMIQAYVPKKVELRVTVAGARVLAAQIESQGTNHTRDDWRHYDNAHTPLRPYPLPDPVADRCVALTRALGLRYAAIDLIVTPDGRHVFIELNPSGQYHWIEVMAGLPITSAIADVLTGAGDDAREACP